MAADTPYVGTEAAGTLASHIRKRLLVAATMPTASEEYKGQQILYVGPSTTTLNKGGVYECDEVAGTDPAKYEWTLISANPLEFSEEDFEVENKEVSLATGQKIKSFTQAEWDALAAEEKISIAGQNVVITDDEGTQTFDEIIPSDASARNKLVAENTIGDLADLETTAKTNVVSAINEVANKESSDAFSSGYYQEQLPSRYATGITAAQLGTLIGKQLSTLTAGQGVLLQGFTQRANATECLSFSVFLQKTASVFRSHSAIADTNIDIDLSAGEGDIDITNGTDSAVTIFLNVVGVNASIVI